MTKPKIGNPELLKLAVKTIESDLSRWDQRWFSSTDRDNAWTTGTRNHLVDIEACGTTFCLAGHVALLTGAVPQANGAWRQPDAGQACGPMELAANALGLDDEQADTLFYEIWQDDKHTIPYSGNSLKSWPKYKQLVTEVTGVEFD